MLSLFEMLGSDRISTIIGCHGVMTILSHELAIYEWTTSRGAVLLIIDQFCGMEILLYFSLGSPMYCMLLLL
jgi:hypothetical protein